MSDTRILANDDSALLRRWHRQVVEQPPNDFVILVSASSSTPVSGTGKTTLLIQLAKKFDRSPGPFGAEQQATLDVGTLAYDLAPNLPAGAALVGDEVQGTPGATGFDNRRGMKTEVIDGINAILANRNSGYTVILGAQQIGSLDSRLIPIIDIWILIREAPPEPVATVHTIHDNDFNLSSVEPKTPRIETITWERIPASNENYATLEEMKEQAKTRGGSDDDDSGTDELPKPAQIELAQALRNTGLTLREIEENDKITYSRQWISEHTTADSDDEKPETATV